jgi:hypothetical protein
MGTAACGVSVTQPISAGVGSAVESGSDAAGAPDGAPSDPLSEGLVAYWKLDENSAIDEVVDSSGHGHTGVPLNGPMPSAVHPPVKFDDPASRTFDGTSQYVIIANSAELNFTGEITLAAWVNVAAITDGCHYVVAHGYCYAPPGEVALRIGSDTCGPGGSPHNWAAGAWLDAEHSAVTPMSDMDINVWLHIAGVYDGTAWILYKNGAEVARQVSTVGAVPVQADWSIGARAPAVLPCVPEPVERFFDGSIDDVRIYNRALSPTEMLELYHR